MNEIIFAVEQKKHVKIKETEVLGSTQTSTHAPHTWRRQNIGDLFVEITK